MANYNRRFPPARSPIPMFHPNAFCAVVLALCIGMGDLRAEEEKNKLVFRIASGEPAPGRVEHRLPGSKDVVYVSRKDVIDARHIERVSFFRDQVGQRAIGLVFSDKGADRIAQATSENIVAVDAARSDPLTQPAAKFKRLAILVDGNVIAAPNIVTEIGKRAQISGNFSDEELTRVFAAIVLGKDSLGKKP